MAHNGWNEHVELCVMHGVCPNKYDGDARLNLKKDKDTFQRGQETRACCWKDWEKEIIKMESVDVRGWKAMGQKLPWYSFVQVQVLPSELPPQPAHIETPQDEDEEDQDEHGTENQLALF